MALSVTIPVQANSEQQMALRFADSVELAGKYALTEMRPTANFQGASLNRIRQSAEEEGGNIKARVSSYWITAFTGKKRTTVIDVWLTHRNDGIYMTRYKLYSDDHNIPIMNPQDMKTNVRLIVSGNGNQADDF